MTGLLTELFAEYFFSTQCTNLGDIPEGDKD